MPQIIVPIPEASLLRRRLLIAVAVVLSLYVAYLVREIWLPLGLAFLIALVLDPVVDQMEVRGWPRPRATVFIFSAFLIITSAVVMVLWPFLVDQLASLQEGFTKFFPDTSHAGLVKSFQKLNLPEGMWRSGVRVFESVQANLQQSGTWLTDYGMRFVSNLVWVAIVPIVAFYALRDFHTILAKGLLIVPPSQRPLVQTAVTEISAVFSRFLRGLAIVSILNGVATWLLLLVLRVPSALVLGAVAGILYGVPYLGAILTTLLTAAVAFLAGGVPMLTASVIASLILHQLIFDQIITPRILGGHVGLHPILSIIALLTGNLLLGIIGMILAVPIAACLQIAILALVPKLSQPIDLSAPASDELASEVLAGHLQVESASDLHQMVSNAVDSVERQIRSD